MKFTSPDKRSSLATITSPLRLPGGLNRSCQLGTPFQGISALADFNLHVFVGE
jgi:hypothetical protein